MAKVMIIKDADFSVNKVEKIEFLPDPILSVENFDMANSSLSTASTTQQGRIWYPILITQGKTYRFILHVTGTIQRSGTYDICCVRMVNTATARTGEDAIPTKTVQNIPDGQSLDNYTFDETIEAANNHTCIYILLCWSLDSPQITPILNLHVYELEGA